MITPKMKSLAVDLQGALGGKDGKLINDSIIALIVEMGGSEVIAKQLLTPISQMVYLQTLLIQQIPTLSLGPTSTGDVSVNVEAPLRLPAGKLMLLGAKPVVGRAPGEQPYDVGGEGDVGGEQPG